MKIILKVLSLVFFLINKHPSHQIELSSIILIRYSKFDLFDIKYR
jgi:hypothetical protein